MPKVVREDIDSLNTVLAITIGKEDYESKLKQELKKIAESRAMKGFRKGKTPVSFLKKMYGKKVLGDIVSQMLQSELAEVMSGEDQRYLGQPIPTEDHRPIDFNINNLEDYTFRFSVGVAPSFEILGVDKDNTFDFFTVGVPDEKVDEQLDEMRKRFGEKEETTDDILEDDAVTFNAVELDGDAPKAGGWKTTFDILVQRIGDEAFKKELLGKKQGDTVRFNVFSLEANTGETYVKKYLLNFKEADIEDGTETGEMYEAVIETVRRMVPAELNQKFFDAVFGEGAVTNEEQARDAISKNIGRQNESNAVTLLYRDLHIRLVDMNRENMPLPEDFLKRWVKSSHKKEEANILENFGKFSDDMRWGLIKNKLYKQFEIELFEREVRESALHRVAGYFGGYQMEILENVVNKIMEDPEQVNSIASDVLSNKLFYKLKDAVSLHEIAITEEEMEQKMKEMEAEKKAAETIAAAPEAEPAEQTEE
jgi:trigger factor